MKIITTLVMFLTLFSLNTFAQDYTQWGLSEGAKARLGKGNLYEITYSPDGTRLAVASGIGIWVHDMETYQALVLLTGYAGGVSSIAFSPDGNKIASASDDNTVRLWDAASGNPIHTLTGYSVVFSPDGNTIASASEGNTVRLWDVASGNIIHTLTGHTDRVDSVSFSPDGNKIASGGR